MIDVGESKGVLSLAEEIYLNKVSSADSLHVACSIMGFCDYFITTDDVLIKRLKNYDLMRVINPIQFYKSNLTI